MSYHSTVEGDLFIAPPLNAEELRNIPTLPTNNGRVMDEVQLMVTEEVIHVPEGDLHVRSSAILSVREPNSSWSRSNAPKQIQAVVDAFPTHEFSGYMEFLGEDGARWRLYVIDRYVTVIKPTITWDVPGG